MVVALPETEDQVPRAARLPRACVPVVARGAGTGLSGGAMPHARACCCRWPSSTASSRIDPRGAHRRGAARRAQPGDVRGGGALRPLLRARSVAQIACTHRRQRRRKLRRRALPEVRPDGAQRAARARAAPSRARSVEIGSEALDAPGYDLLALIIGSEGMLARGHRSDRQAGAASRELRAGA